jgi:hypothetical protein
MRGTIFRHVCSIANATVIFIMSVHALATMWLPLDGFSWNLIFEDFSKLYLKNSSLIKISQE